MRRAVKLGECGVAVGEGPSATSACERRDDARGNVDASNARLDSVGHQRKYAVGRNGNALRTEEESRGTVSVCSSRTVTTSQSADVTGRNLDAPHAMIARICDQRKHAVRRNRNSAWRIKLGHRTDTVCKTLACARASERRHNIRHSVNTPNAMIATIGNQCE